MIEDDLERVALALFNNVTAIGNREHIYTIAATPGFNVRRFEYAAQYKGLSTQTCLLASGNTESSAQPVSTAASGAMCSDAKNVEGLRSGLEEMKRPLGNKASKRNKRARKSSEGVEVAASVKKLSEQLRNSDNNFAQCPEEKHILENSHTCSKCIRRCLYMSDRLPQKKKSTNRGETSKTICSSLGEVTIEKSRA
jgi:hypothetical protein